MTMAEDGLALPAELFLSSARHAVYRCYSDHGELLYVGTTGQIGRRLGEHAQKAWFLQVRGIALEWYPDEVEAGLAERRAIYIERPKYNVLHKTARLSVIKPDAPKRKARRRATVPADVRAAEVLARDPGISGAELARRLGVSPAHGRRLHARLAAEVLPAEPSGERSERGSDERTGERS